MKTNLPVRAADAADIHPGDLVSVDDWSFAKRDLEKGSIRALEAPHKLDPGDDVGLAFVDAIRDLSGVKGEILVFEAEPVGGHDG